MVAVTSIAHKETIAAVRLDEAKNITVQYRDNRYIEMIHLLQLGQMLYISPLCFNERCAHFFS